jgi:hypothetical protein
MFGAARKDYGRAIPTHIAPKAQQVLAFGGRGDGSVATMMLSMGVIWPA